MKLKRRLEQYDYFHPRFYVEDVNNPSTTDDFPLRQKALPFEFPLTLTDKNDILRFMTHYDGRKVKLILAAPEYLSFSAPQIGIQRRLIVFSVPFGRGVIQPFKKTIWLNPEYEQIVDDVEEDYDICLSVNMVAPVQRYKRIYYKAYDLKGKLVEGEAQGKAARAIQHEIDHLDGKLISDYVQRDQLITIEEFKQKKKDAWGGKGWMDCLPEIKQELKELREYYPDLKPKTKKKKSKAKKKKGKKR